MTFIIAEPTPKATVERIAEYFLWEGARLNRLAGLTTGPSKRELTATAKYAYRQAEFFQTIEVLEP